MLAATTAANALLITSGVAILPFGIMLGVASYFAAARLPRLVSIRAAIISAAAVGGALIYTALIYTALTVHNAAVADEAVESLLPLMAGWFTGDSVAARRRYLAGLADQARNEQAAEAERARQQVREERVRIAREMHDVVAHTLAVITVQAGVGRRLMARQPEEASTALESIETIGRTAQEELRVVLGLLRDQENRTAVLAPAPRLVDVKDLGRAQESRPRPGRAHRTRARGAVVGRPGLSNAELAETLRVSLPTAKTHVSRILTKLGARDRAQIVVLAYESGLVTTT